MKPSGIVTLKDDVIELGREYSPSFKSLAEELRVSKVNWHCQAHCYEDSKCKDCREEETVRRCTKKIHTDLDETQ